MSEPVLDPELPEKEQRLLRENPSVLYPVGERPEPPRFGGRNRRDLLFCMFHMPLWAMVPGLMGLTLNGRPRLLCWIPQLALIAVGILAGFDALLRTVVLIQLPVFLVLVWLCGEPPAARSARRHHGRYMRRRDLDAVGANLLDRTVTAVDTVLSSETNTDGLLDDVRNSVTLPAQRWEIAQTLRELTRLRGEQEDAVAGVRRTDPKIRAMLSPQIKALELATASVTERIEALERYADRVTTADQALRRWKAVQRLASSSDDYSELLARTVRDELAVAEIDGLTEQARQVEQALKASVEKARRAGLVLVPELAEAS